MYLPASSIVTFLMVNLEEVSSFLNTDTFPSSSSISSPSFCQLMSPSPPATGQEKGSNGGRDKKSENKWMENVQVQLIMKWNWNHSPLHNRKASSPTGKSCFLIMMSILASRGREQKSFVLHLLLYFTKGIKRTTPNSSAVQTCC